MCKDQFKQANKLPLENETIRLTTMKPFEKCFTFISNQNQKSWTTISMTTKQTSSTLSIMKSIYQSKSNDHWRKLQLCISIEPRIRHAFKPIVYFLSTNVMQNQDQNQDQNQRVVKQVVGSVFFETPAFRYALVQTNSLNSILSYICRINSFIEGENTHNDQP